MEYEDSEFDWEEYMEDTNSAAAPDAAFPHVSRKMSRIFVLAKIDLSSKVKAP